MTDSGDSQFMPSVSGGESGVVSWRLLQVEQGQARIEGKLDAMASVFVPHKTLDLILKPLQDEILALKQDKQEKEQQESNYRAQLKLAIFVASVSPIASAVVAYIVGSK